jgi:PAT family beta-lactamase induction signal transducer AmpG
MGSWLLSKYGFGTAMLMVAVVIAIVMLAPLFLRERQGEKIAPWTSGKASPETSSLQLNGWRSIFKSLYTVFSLRNSLLIALLLFICQGSAKYISTLLPIFTVKELGWTNVEYAQYFAAAKLIGGIAGMILGGILIDKYGKKRMMNIYFMSFIVLISVFSCLNNYWADRNFIYAFMILQNVLYTFASIGVFAIAMQCCWKKVSASQFTLYMTIANLGQMVFAAAIGPMKAHFDWQITLFAFAVFTALAWFLLQFLNIDKQLERVHALESQDLTNEVVNAK